MVHALVYTAIALLILTWAGNILCRAIFKITGLKDAISIHPAPTHTAGRWIGNFERVILSIGFLTQSWEILAAVIALKTVARFAEMDKRDFAEYFLVGSLFSILWAILVTGAWQAYDQKFGINLRQQAQQLLGVLVRDEIASSEPLRQQTGISPLQHK